MIGAYRHIVFPLFLIFFICSCNTKTEEEKLEEKYNREYCDSILSMAISKYMDIKWDSIDHFISRVDNSLYSHYYLFVDGDGISKNYGNAKFHVNSTWEIVGNGQYLFFQSLSVQHSDLGSIITINDPKDSMINHIIDSTNFKIKLKNHSKIKSEIYRERANAVRLAYQNKTKVHFGVSEDDYNHFDAGFQKNFIDGLIGNGAYELAQPVFAKDKLVGFEICSWRGSRCGHENIIDNAEVVKTRQSEVNRFSITETDYVSPLYNLRIRTSTNEASGEYTEIITVYWNSYLKIYK